MKKLNGVIGSYNYAGVKVELNRQDGMFYVTSTGKVVSHQNTSHENIARMWFRDAVRRALIVDPTLNDIK